MSVVYTRLRGGPSDGLCAVTNGECPVVILELPRPPDIHEVPIREAIWDETTRWYAVPTEVNLPE